MLVVDASFLMAAFVEEDHTEFARSTMIAQGERMRIAPSLVAWEFANILWKKWRKAQITERHLAEANDFLSALDIDTTASLQLDSVGHLAAVARATGLTAYDAAYVDLAVAHSAALATIDRDLTRAAVANGLMVYSPFA